MDITIEGKIAREKYEKEKISRAYHEVFTAIPLIISLVALIVSIKQ